MWDLINRKHRLKMRWKINRVTLKEDGGGGVANQGIRILLGKLYHKINGMSNTLNLPNFVCTFRNWPCKNPSLVDLYLDQPHLRKETTEPILKVLHLFLFETDHKHGCDLKVNKPFQN